MVVRARGRPSSPERSTSSMPASSGVCGAASLRGGFFNPWPRASSAKATFDGGVQTAALGLALHFFIAISMAVAYYLVARRWPLLWRQPWLCGAVYGVFLYVFMNYVVVPLAGGGGIQGRPLDHAQRPRSHGAGGDPLCGVRAARDLAAPPVVSRRRRVGTALRTRPPVESPAGRPASARSGWTRSSGNEAVVETAAHELPRRRAAASRGPGTRVRRDRDLRPPRGHRVGRRGAGQPPVGHGAETQAVGREVRRAREYLQRVRHEVAVELRGEGSVRRRRTNPPGRVPSRRRSAARSSPSASRTAHRPVEDAGAMDLEDQAAPLRGRCRRRARAASARPPPGDGHRATRNRHRTSRSSRYSAGRRRRHAWPGLVFLPARRRRPRVAHGGTRRAR